MRKFKLSDSVLQLFAEGGDGGGAGAAGPTAIAEPAQPQFTGVKENPLANVQYGREETAPDAGDAKAAEADRNARFDALIKGEFKDLYDQRMQDTIRKRLRGNEEIVRKYNSLSGTFDLLADKYGLDADAPDFVEELTKEIEADESLYESKALETGQTTQQVRENRKLLRENRALTEQLNQQKDRQHAEEVFAEWHRQAEELKEIYPAFDMAMELENPLFRNLLNSNIPVRIAFEVVHHDEIVPAAMQYTARKVTQKVANSIRAGQGRPSEGALSRGGGVMRKTDVNSLTRADIEEINRRVARGERVTF